MKTAQNASELIDAWLDLGAAKKVLDHRGAEVEFRWSTSSTNDDLKTLGRERVFVRPHLLAALHQTAGRGTRGRVWQRIGNTGDALTFSIGLPFPEFACRAPGLLSIATGVGVVRHLRGLGFNVGLKWPNDIWICGGKVGGILCEAVRDPNGRSSVVIGIGLNILLREELKDSTTSGWSIRALTDDASRWGTPVNRTALLTGIACSVLDMLKDPVDLTEAFIAVDAFAGRSVFWRDGLGGTSEGIDRGIDAMGRLRIETQHGEVILSGDASLINASGGGSDGTAR